MAQRGVVPRRRRVKRREIPFLAKLVFFLKNSAKLIFSVIWPIILLPILYKATLTRKMTYVWLLMVGYSVVGCLPFVMASLIPIPLIPMLGVRDTDLDEYADRDMMEVLSGVIISIAIEDTNLSKRIALFVLSKFGCTHGILLAIVWIFSTSVSMWVTDSLITPINIVFVIAILRQLEEAGCFQAFINVMNNPLYPEGTFKPSKIAMGYLFCAAYCMNIGSSATFVSQIGNSYIYMWLRSLYNVKIEINYKRYLKASVSQVIINSFLTWIYCQVIFMGFLRPKSEEAKLAKLTKEDKKLKKQILKERYKEMGKFTFREVIVALATLFALIFNAAREPYVSVGWDRLIGDDGKPDSRHKFPWPAILASITLLLLPRDIKFIYSWHSDPEKRPTEPGQSILAWSTLCSKLPWSFLFMFGGIHTISSCLLNDRNADMIDKTVKGLKNLCRLYPYLRGKLLVFAALVITGGYTEMYFTQYLLYYNIREYIYMCQALRIHPLGICGSANNMGSYSFRCPYGSVPGMALASICRVPVKSYFVYGTIPAIYTLIVLTLLSEKMWRFESFDVSFGQNISETYPVY